MFDKAKMAVQNNVDKRIVVSTAIGVALFGVVAYGAIRSGIKPLQQVGKVAKGGAK